MADQAEIKALLNRYLEGTCMPEEKVQVEAWYNAQAKKDRHTPLADWDYDTIKDEVFQYVQAHKEPLASRVSRRFTRWLPYAAVLILALAVGYFFWEQDNRTTNQDYVATEITPGGNRAILTLADGRAIDLIEAQSGIVIGEDITYADGSEVVETQNPLSSTQYLSLTTPKGGQYQVTLPDGSKVWLNSASTLKYPSQFAADERVVELTGEAYFDVREQTVDNSKQTNKNLRASASRVPFKVITRGQTVEVLGTEFNITAYPDEQDAKTTLVEGKVKINDRVLSPGEQATTRGSHTDVTQVNVTQYTAWKDGLFDFTGKTLQELMPELARWYDIEVVYEGDIRPVKYVGRIFRDNNLHEVLEILKTAKVRYRLEGRRLIIIKN